MYKVETCINENEYVSIGGNTVVCTEIEELGMEENAINLYSAGISQLIATRNVNKQKMKLFLI